MGEANRRKKADAAREAAGLPTQRAVPAQQLINPGRQLPTPEYEKWGKPEDSWYPGKKNVVLEPLRPAEAFKVKQSIDFLNRLFSYEDMASEEYDPIEASKPYKGQRSFGRKNVYVCDSGHETVTVDSAEGVTPFMILCPECKEYARSKFYRVDQTLDASHEWYRPKDLKGLHPASRDHVERGGLIMRKIDSNEPEQAAKH